MRVTSAMTKRKSTLMSGPTACYVVGAAESRIIDLKIVVFVMRAWWGRRG